MIPRATNQISTETPRELGRGVVATTTTPVFTAPPSQRMRLTSIWLYNTNAAVQTIGLHTTKDGVTLRMRQTQLAQHESGDWLAEEGELTLEPGSSIDLQTTTASAVNYAVHGYQLAPVQTTATT